MNLPNAFWDSSVLVALCLTEETSEKAREWARRYSIVVWWATRVELQSAIARQYRSRSPADLDRRDAIAACEALAGGWIEILPGDEVREMAIAVLDRYPLRAADSLQLAAAMIWCRNRPVGRTFICADDRLCDAAAQAGFTVLRP